jgi:hypothetical protein
MVLALGVGLSMADEPLLEKLLTDRSKEVRENAARLLSLCRKARTACASWAGCSPC